MGQRLEFSSSPASKPFLTARWANLIIVSYHASAEVLAPHVPEGLELDPICGRPTVSLVGFEFADTRVMGVRWPGFANFPELNLRLYVRETARTAQAHGRAPRRGVVFIREFVASRVIASIAYRIYNEPYAVAPFTHEIGRTDGSISARYSVRFGGREHALRASALDELIVPESGCTEDLLKEQEWGYGRTRGGATLGYRVTHPTWRVFKDAACEIDVDWGVLYGSKWAVMREAAPFSTLLVEGSRVEVFGARAVTSSERSEGAPL